MKKVAVVYWSGSGNTEEMAKAVLEGAKKGGADAELKRFEDFKVADMAGYDGFLFGCPATGSEELQEDYVEPFFAEAESKLSGVPVGLFGSYGWGGGAFMESWAERVRTAGAKLVSDGLVVENAPDDDGLKACEELGEALDFGQGWFRAYALLPLCADVRGNQACEPCFFSEEPIRGFRCAS